MAEMTGLFVGHVAHFRADCGEMIRGRVIRVADAVLVRRLDGPDSTRRPDGLYTFTAADYVREGYSGSRDGGPVNS